MFWTFDAVVPVSHGKIAPLKNRRGGGDFLSDGDRETFALRQFIQLRRLWENRPSAIYSRSPSVRKSAPIVWSLDIRPHDGDFLNGATFSRGD